MAEWKDLSSPLLPKTPKSKLIEQQSSTEKTGTYQRRYATSKDKWKGT